MKQARRYFVFNKAADFHRARLDNLSCLGESVRIADTRRPGILWSRLLDSREKETVWHRMTMDLRNPGSAAIRFRFYASDSRTAVWRGQARDLEELLFDPEMTDENLLELCAADFKKAALSPEDILLHEIDGQYLWFRAELTAQDGDSPEMGRIKLRFPKETWLSYLPEVYQSDPSGKSFTERFLGIFQSLHDDLDADIREVSRLFDPDVAEGSYLEWLAGWLDVEDGYLWPEDKLRKLVKRAMELYRIRGTRRCVVEMVKLYTGLEPYVVEYSQIEPLLSDVGQRGRLLTLYGRDPSMVTLVLTELSSADAYRALSRIVSDVCPAWIQVNLVVLKPYLFLDQYTYLGMNSLLARYRGVSLDGTSALPFTSLDGPPDNSNQ